jgi:uncharacterized protein (DUF1800 family)
VKSYFIQIFTFNHITVSTLFLTLSCFSAFSAPAKALSVNEARHLWGRTGFGSASQKEILSLKQLNRERAVAFLLNQIRQEPYTGKFRQASNPLSRPGKQATPAERKAYRKQLRAQGFQLKAWWYQEMLTTPSPLTENLTLFWHNHFTSSLQKVHAPALMAQQNQTLRRFALGDFRQLLFAIAKDPAMLIYLDGQNNRKQEPNENFARELLELFTLGEGYYSEQDIQSAARAFTGWSLDSKKTAFVFKPKKNDPGEKVFLAQKGSWQGEDILRMILEQPQTANFISKKLRSQFIAKIADTSEIERLANIFRKNYSIQALLEAILLSSDFWAENERGKMIKSPVEFIIGTMRSLQISDIATPQLVITAKKMGQDIFDPPNVKGWSGGQNWINSKTLLMRQQWAYQLTREQNNQILKTNISGSPLQELSRGELEQMFFPINPLNFDQATTTNLNETLRQIILDPVFQLK